MQRKAAPTEALEARSTEMALPAWELGRRQAAARAAPAGGATGAGGRARPKLRDHWTAAEVALLDEAVALVTGEGRTYGTSSWTRPRTSHRCSCAWSRGVRLLDR